MHRTAKIVCGAAVISIAVAGTLAAALRPANLLSGGVTVSLPPVAGPPVEAIPAPGDTASMESGAAPDPAAAGEIALPKLAEVWIEPRVAKPVPEERPADERALSLAAVAATLDSASRPLSSAAPLAGDAVPRQFEGRAKATGAVTMMVGDIRVRLFGIRPPEANDRCGTNPSTGCSGIAQAALAARLAPAASVSCRLPLASSDAVVPAICRDSAGVDLSSFLVGEGLALANPSQSYDYVGAETSAHKAKRGLWTGR
jgi:endonuclease YncB( thermonuclease family)